MRIFVKYSSSLAGKAAWGGCPLEPDVLLRLAQAPPATAAELADVTGVGPAMVERLGGTMLRALGAAPTPKPATIPVPPFATAKWAALSAWRADVARSMGVPPYVVLSDEVLRAVAAARPRDRAALARIAGIGPRVLAKFAADLVALSDDTTAT